MQSWCDPERYKNYWHVQLANPRNYYGPIEMVTEYYTSSEIMISHRCTILTKSSCEPCKSTPILLWSNYSRTENFRVFLICKRFIPWTFFVLHYQNVFTHKTETCLRHWEVLSYVKCDCSLKADCVYRKKKGYLLSEIAPVKCSWLSGILSVMKNYLGMEQEWFVVACSIEAIIGIVFMFKHL